MKKFNEFTMPARISPFFVQGTQINAEGQWESNQREIARAVNRAFPIICNEGVELTEDQIDNLFHVTATVKREVIDGNSMKTIVTSTKREGLLENAGIFGFSGNDGIVYTSSGSVAFKRNHADQVYKAWFLPA